MANAIFDAGREGFLDGTINWDTGVIKAALVRDYIFSAAHRTVLDVVNSGATLHATSSAFTNKTEVAGVADADNLNFGVVAANASNHYLLVFQSSAPTGGADIGQSTQRVICWLDTGTGLPVVPSGSQVLTTWDDNANKIFKL